MPPRRYSVGSDAGANDVDELDSDEEHVVPLSGPMRRGRGGGRGRGRGRGRGGRGRGGRGGANGGRVVPVIRSDDEDEEDESGGLPTRAPRPVSPELGVPPVAPEPAPSTISAVAVPGRSSSLSALSSRSPSPATAIPGSSQNHPAPSENDQTPIKREQSFSHLNSRSQRSNLADELDYGSPSSVGTPRRPATVKDDPTADSLSELDSDGEDGPLSNFPPSSSRDVSVASTPAPSAIDDGDSPSAVPTPKKRGRPLGSRNKQHKPPIPRSQRAAAAAAAAAASTAAPVTASTKASPSVTPGPSSSQPRATRANVTLPAGYIEGVTSSRWPKKKDEDDTGADTTTPDESRASSVATNGAEEDKTMLTPKADRKGKGRAMDEDEDELMDELDELSGTPMSRETSLDGPPTPAKGRGGPGRGRGRGRGRGGKKAQSLPEPVERAKRRKVDALDEETAGRLAAREAARQKFLEQLEVEARAVVARTHPLLDFTYQRLAEEKAQKLEQLRLNHEERELESARVAEAQLQQIWGAWADRKDTLRTDLYLENHGLLKQVVAEEKVFPFFRDHPLFTNSHDLPPGPHFRAPMRDPSFVPRAVIHAGHYVEPPPLNPAVEHDSWRLSPSEIEADLALFYDIDDEPYEPPAPIPPPVPVAYPYASPYYYDPAVPPPPVPAPYMAPHPSHPPPYPSMMPLGYPPPMPPYYPPPPHPAAAAAAPPPHPHAHSFPPSSAQPRPANELRQPSGGVQQQSPPRRSPDLARNPAPPAAAAAPSPQPPKPVEPPSGLAKQPVASSAQPAAKSAMNGHASAPRPPAATASHPPQSHSHPHSHSHQHLDKHHPSVPPVSSLFPSFTASLNGSKPSLPSLTSSAYPSSVPRVPFIPASAAITGAHSSTTSSAANGHSHGGPSPSTHLSNRSPHLPPASSVSPSLPASAQVQPRVSPSLSAPKLPSLTHRPATNGAAAQSASPPLSSSTTPLLPSLFGSAGSSSLLNGSGAGSTGGGGGSTGYRPPIGLGSMMLNGGGLGGMNAPLGFGPATGLPLPSWLKPLQKPGAGAGGGEAQKTAVAAPAAANGGKEGKAVSSLQAQQPPPHVSHVPRPYWA
ncbi:hypothetical protein JCM8547_004972 [Rhodosporidiobolus lusitaniae]